MEFPLTDSVRGIALVIYFFVMPIVLLFFSNWKSDATRLEALTFVLLWPYWAILYGIMLALTIADKWLSEPAFPKKRGGLK